jgi:bifunctional UDP-N-acetylglucosamine pyrophosphorylase/glucosamine-1-phosphate N-acetyltransferase
MNNPNAAAGLILAAGEGKRMRSDVPKPLHTIAGLAMVGHAARAAAAAGCRHLVIVTMPGEAGAAVFEAARAAVSVPCVQAVQDPPLGTGHAAQMGLDAVGEDVERILIHFSDMPLVQALTLQNVMKAGQDGMGLLGFSSRQPGYGRFVQDGEAVLKIVEWADASEDERTLTACNAGIMAAPRALWAKVLPELESANVQQEYYLTDAVARARQHGNRVTAQFASEAECSGVNDRHGLNRVRQLWQMGRRSALIEEGVDMEAPDTVHLHHDTVLEAGAVVEPNVVFAAEVRVEPGARVRSFSHLEGCVVRGGAVVGPFARIRPGSDIGEDARIGNFVEVKNSRLHKGVKAGHLAYLGDAELSAHVNVGAGVVTCNFDGVEKHRTHVGEGAFLGTNSSLVAPISVGAGAYVAAGSTVNRDVKEGDLAIARPRQKTIRGGAERLRGRGKKESS